MTKQVREWENMKAKAKQNNKEEEEKEEEIKQGVHRVSTQGEPARHHESAERSRVSKQRRDYVQEEGASFFETVVTVFEGYGRFVPREFLRGDSSGRAQREWGLVVDGFEEQSSRSHQTKGLASPVQASADCEGHVARHGAGTGEPEGQRCSEGTEFGRSE